MQSNKELLKFSEVGDGQTIIFISGLSVDKNIWDNIIQNIKNDFHIIYFDNRGVGENGKLVAPLTTYEMAMDVVGILENLKLKKVSIVGHSLGSYVAQHVAANCPDIVEKLVLISSRLKSSLITRLHYNVIFKLLKANVPREVLVEDSLSWLYGNTYLQNLQNTEKLIQEKLLINQVLSLDNFSNQVTSALQHNGYEISKKITSDTLLINGDEDILCTPKEAAILSSHIKNSELLILENVGHMALVEAPDCLANIVKNFCLKEESCGSQSFNQQ
jgi:pimeloyl-ACP methyl ester carboxylesterase